MPRAEQRDWIMVRIRRDTHRRLQEIAAIWKQQAEVRNDLPAADDRDRIGLDRVIAELIRRDDSHRARAKRKVSSRSRTAQEVAAPDGPSPTEDVPATPA